MHPARWLKQQEQLLDGMTPEACGKVGHEGVLFFRDDFYFRVYLRVVFAGLALEMGGIPLGLAGVTVGKDAGKSEKHNRIHNSRYDHWRASKESCSSWPVILKPTARMRPLQRKV